MNLLAAVPNIPTPSQDVVDDAATLVSSTVFGAAFILMLVIFVGITTYLLYLLKVERRSSASILVEKDRIHSEEKAAKDVLWSTTIKNSLADQEKAFKRERDAFNRERDDWSERFQKYAELLNNKDVMVNEIQDKRVDLAEKAIAASTDGTNQNRRLADLIERALTPSQDPDPQD